MSLKMKAGSNLGQASASVAGMAKQIRFASAVALTRTARQIKAAEELEMRDVFERPTPYTMSAVYMRPATKADLTAEVGLKNFASKAVPAAKYLLPQIVGGSRRPKRFERALQAVGALPAGYRAVPGSAAQVDVFGNISRGQIVQILSFFKAFPEMGYKANMSDKRRAQLARGSRQRQGFTYFVGTPGGRLPLGIWQRIPFARGSAVKPVMIFVPSTTYEAIFDFGYVARMVVDRELDAQFRRAFDEAMASVRP